MGATKAYSYVRMSTDAQLKGDSLRRQLALSESYAEAHGLELVKDELHDIGVSAYNSDNLRAGQLGRFIQGAREGKIERGSYLLVESLDRLSRDQVLNALGLFQEILRHDITIVTLTDNQVYSSKSVADNPFQLLLSITVMIRAHEESQIKSRRVAAAWEEKRRQIAHKKLTANGPYWLMLSEDRTEFHVIEERATLVRHIFELARDGLGVESIARRLNSEGVPHWGRSDGWHISYLKKLLDNRAVLGELTTYKKISGDRTPVEIIPDYFPPIVTPELFYSAHRSIALRRGKGGPKGRNVANLFSGIAKCGYCGGSLILKDGGGKSGKYLICSRAKRGLGCSGNGFPYITLEHSFLEMLHEVNLDDILSDYPIKSEAEKLRNRLHGKQGEHNAVLAQISKIFKLIDGESQDLPRTILSHLRVLEGQADKLVCEISEIENDIVAIDRRPKEMTAAVLDVKRWVEQLEKWGEEKREDVRVKLKQKIAELVEYIYLYPCGRKPKIQLDEERERLYSVMREMLPEYPADKLKRYFEARKLNDNKGDRVYLAKFKSGRLFTMNVNRKDASDWRLGIESSAPVVDSED